jgi:membrane-associated protease RseP (regulator of RpoE activity)
MMDQERQIQLTNDRAIDQFNGGAQSGGQGTDIRDVADGQNVQARAGRSDWVWPIGLFVATVFTTLWAGAYATNADPFLGAWRFLVNNPAALWKGVPFAATLLGILVTHEFGHYLLSRVHRVPASLPLFIPGPPHFIGTFGAIIRMRGPILSRKALFDIGVAGPIAGFVVAVIALIIGLRWSTVVVDQELYGLRLGEPLLLQFFSWLVIGVIPQGYDVVLHPVAFAAWFGLFVTSLNLIPIGQLDGGHVAYALWGSRQRSIALAVVPILLILGFIGWPGWFLWAGMAGVLGLAHPPVLDPDTLLGRTRIWIGWAAMAIFALTFAPIPFSVH